MQVEEATKLIEAIAKLVGAIAWPVVVALGLFLFRLSTLSEVRIKGKGFEGSLVRRWDVDATSQKLRDFWRPNGKVDKSHAAQIAACMNELGISGSVASFINAGRPEDRARVASRLSIFP
jgi:hypothetical protein